MASDKPTPAISRKELAAKISWINRSISTARVSIGEVRYQPGGIWRPYRQHFYDLGILHTGACTVTVDDETIDLEVGMIYIFFPGHRQHSHFSRTVETHHSWCKIRGSHMPKNMRDALERGPRSVVPSPTWLGLLKTSMGLGPPHDEADGWEIDYLAMALFAEFLRCATAASAKKRLDDSVRKAIAWMHDHMGEDGCLAGAQKVSGLCQNALISRFQASLQITPARYLWKLRTERGIAMLKEGGLRVSDIAYHCGFKNPFHFSRLVRQFQGASPLQIRQQGLKQQ